MNYVRLGTSGLKVSRVCLGMMSYGDRQWREWMLDESQAEPIIRRAVERGVIFFDTANIYSNGASEEITGRLLDKFFRVEKITFWRPKLTRVWGLDRMITDSLENTS